MHASIISNSPYSLVYSKSLVLCYMLLWLHQMMQRSKAASAQAALGSWSALTTGPINTAITNLNDDPASVFQTPRGRGTWGDARGAHGSDF